MYYCLCCYKNYNYNLYLQHLRVNGFRNISNYFNDILQLLLKDNLKKLFNKKLKELSKLIDKYLIPQELEKKTNAEVSTPFKLRQEMLGINNNILDRCYTHSTTKKNIVKYDEDNIYKYKLVHTTTLKGVNFLYTNKNDIGYFGIRKLVFGDSGINDVVIDYDGLYGVTEHAISIKFINIEEAIQIKKVLLSNNFKIFLKSCSWSNYQIDRRLFSYLKNDFWKEFI